MTTPSFLRRLVLGSGLIAACFAQNPPDEQRLAPPISATVVAEEGYYHREALPIPENVQLEVGGLLALPNRRLIATTRRGEVWWIDGAYDTPARLRFTRFASGLHEPLGIALAPGGGFYVVQRTEVTRLVDTDGDGRADRYETVIDIPASGNFHEFAYGPVVAPDGTMRISMNLGFGIPDASSVPWRGWMLEIDREGHATPIAAGMRSPSSFIRTSRGDWFYSENQGEWIASGWVAHVERGDFFGHPASLAWAKLPGSPIKLTAAEVGDPDEPFPVAAKRVPGLKRPAVWFPQAIMGISTSGIVEDATGGKFGPFASQFFVGDQGQSKVMRMSLERVRGVYQGACYPFRSGMDSGVVRMAWGDDGTLFVGSTSRGWGSVGEKLFALERVRWTGKVPFEIREITAAPDGFHIEFTEPVAPATATDPAAYAITGFTYNYHKDYGSAVVGRMVCPVLKVVVESERRVRLAVACLRDGYIHEVKAPGVRNQANAPLLHDTAYYTLNERPEGAPLVAGAPRSELCDPTAAATASTTLPESPRHCTTRPADWPAGSEVLRRVRTQAGLKFDSVLLTVPRGARVALTIENGDDMLHNWVLTVGGKGQEIGAAALALGLDGTAKHFVPDSPHVLAHTSLLAPAAHETIYFTAPGTPGELDYVCSFPGHAPLMNGKLKVE